MLKRIPKSDISIRPFKAYKEWSFDEVSAPSSSIFIYSASVATNSYSFASASIYDPTKTTENKNIIYYPYSIYGSIKSKYYTNVDDVFHRSGVKSNEPAEYTNERYLGSFAKVISIPQSIYGEEIKKGSLILTDVSNNYVFVDNGSGSLKSGSNVVGNIFYDDGLVVYSASGSTTGSVSDVLPNSWTLDFKSTETIYENEYLLIVNEDEFNVSQNPSAVVKVGGITSTFTDSDGIVRTINEEQPARYIRKKTTLDNGTIIDRRFGSSVNSAISGGFEHFDLSGSVDTTGSFLVPFITTIGLYDDNCDLVAVAKLPQPIKSEPDFPVNFIVRFDT
jgi:hypothetical protein